MQAQHVQHDVTGHLWTAAPGSSTLQAYLVWTLFWPLLELPASQDEVLTRSEAMAISCLQASLSCASLDRFDSILRADKSSICAGMTGVTWYYQLSVTPCLGSFHGAGTTVLPVFCMAQSPCVHLQKLHVQCC